MAITVRALAFASRWFDPGIVHRTFEPLIADWQREWRDAPPSRRAWVSVRGFAAFVCAAIISSPRIIATPTPRSIAWPVAKRIALFCLVVGGLLSIPMVRSLGARSMEALSLPALVLFALPAGLTIAFPFAMVFAVDAIRRDDRVPAHVERAAALKLGVIAMLLMLTVGGFVVPAANQEWRERSTPAGWNVPPPQLRELSTYALLTHPDRHTAMVPDNYTRAGEIRRELTNRTVLSILPAMFVWLRWTALAQPRRRRFWPLPAGLMTAVVVVGFFTSIFSGSVLEHVWALAPGTGLWVPVAVFGLWGLVEQLISRATTRSASSPTAPANAGGHR